ncbi:MAG: aminotransferase class V-fold PLP-dependent enzyme [Calditrichaeota bacterium]|nr:aminotransferase class V-fold PLP-dependent enzyme [Calditrichota bacterium]
MTELEKYFQPFRENTVGIDQQFPTPFGIKKIIYADWVASGRLYRPIEDKISRIFGPFVGNTHTETSVTGTTMTAAYHFAHNYIKKHVNAGPEDVIMTPGFGMTAAINKFQRILGLRVPERFRKSIQLSEKKRPVVFVTHMEHHSNQTSWLETIADVVVIPPDKDGLVDLNIVEDHIKKYKNREQKYGAFTACSNVTGIQTPYHQLASLMHQYDGCCFVDFAASAPYVEIDMHPDNPLERLDAIFFSPHKFLGGPGASGVLICNSEFCLKNKIPDQPGGGTVDWTNPWGGVKYMDNIEAREDGGTPGFLQAMRTALAIKLKEKMNPKQMLEREEQLVPTAFRELRKISGINILADNIERRLGIISFYFKDIHHNLIVKLLNDRFGVQVRGGCLCAGTYGHLLLNITPEESKRITDMIDRGDWSEKPGWVRMSIHPTMTDAELMYIIDALKEIVKNHKKWGDEYWYDKHNNEFYHKKFKDEMKDRIPEWFEL